MKIRDLSLHWFRGASEEATLATDDKNIVVYGPNGAGKTSFVDAIEYLLREGRIEHLSHEYGRQFPSAFNTHAPPNAVPKVLMKLDNGADVTTKLSANGSTQIIGKQALGGWDNSRTVLRQDEVANFVRASKGEKYSTLLPLIGLGPMETIATNLRALGRKIRDESRLDHLKGQLQQLRQSWDAAFPGIDRAVVGTIIKDLHAKYLPEAPIPPNISDALKAVHLNVSARIDGLTVEQNRFFLLKSIEDLNITARLEDLSTASNKAAAMAEPLLAERLDILRSSNTFGAMLEKGSIVPCPACGRDIAAEEFKAHVIAESKRLEEALAAFDARNVQFGRLADAMSVVFSALSQPDMSVWSKNPEQAAIFDEIQILARISADQIREGMTAEELEILIQALVPFLAHVNQCVNIVPPPVVDLVKDQKAVEAAGTAGQMKSLSAQIASAQGLLDFLVEVETQVRAEIKEKTEAVIGEISDDMQRMWSLLHPDEPIDEVHLYQADDADKAIDIALRFFGKEQPSPRLTLSEGHRNSLGLCVFFALAKKHGQGFPLVLDDIVTSFDREHRSFVAQLLMQEFPDTQILLFTHDYDWFAELKRLLPGGQWKCKALLPWSDPITGIRWDANAYGFGTARNLLGTDAMSAGNKARAIMDVEMAVVSETLEVPVPHLRGIRNDMRGAVDLLNRFQGRVNKCLKKKNAQGAYSAWDGPNVFAKEASALLVAYGNPASHGRYVTKQEAERLVDVCEKFLLSLNCQTCMTALWHASDGEQTHLRCDCDEVRWMLKH